MGTHPIFESDFDCLTEKRKCLIEKLVCWWLGQLVERRCSELQLRKVLSTTLEWALECLKSKIVRLQLVSALVKRYQILTVKFLDIFVMIKIPNKCFHFKCSI